MVATNIAYHINDTDKSYPATLKTTSRHNSLRGLRHCKHQVLLHVNLASETLYSVSRRYRYPEIYIYQTSNAGGGITKLVTGLKTNGSRKLEPNHFLPVAIRGFPLTSESYSKKGSSEPKIIK